MKKFSFKKLDAFASAGSSGNPAGYIRTESSDLLSDDEMLSIAAELKGFVSEVGYLFPLKNGVYPLRYFSSECEVDFCGHATIAIMYDLISSDPDLLKRREISIETNRGVLTVENRISEENAVYIMSPLPRNSDVSVTNADIAENLSISSGAVRDDYPVSVINAGLSTLLVPIDSLDSILKIRPDLETLKIFCISNNIDIIEVFTPETTDHKNSYRTRVFAPTFGYLEDPATGSGNSAFGYYLIEQGLFAGKTVLIEQNGLREGYNSVKLRVTKDSEGRQRILFGGRAVCRITGEYMLQS